MVTPLYSDFIKGKSVALICGCDTDETEALKADIVIRVNNHWMRTSGRMDVLYFNSAHDTKDMLKGRPEHLKWVCIDKEGTKPKEGIEWAESLGANVYPFVKDAFCEKHFYCIALRSCLKYGRSSPFMGTIAAFHLASLYPKCLYITGMRFFCDVPREQWKIGVCSHNPKANALAMKDLWESGGCIRFGEDVQEALDICKRMDDTDPLTFWRRRELERNCDQKDIKRTVTNEDHYKR